MRRRARETSVTERYGTLSLTVATGASRLCGSDIRFLIVAFGANDLPCLFLVRPLQVRFRVQSVRFPRRPTSEAESKCAPSPPASLSAMLCGSFLQSSALLIRARPPPLRFPRTLTPLEGGFHVNGTSAFAPMVVVGDMNADGLGCLSWWT